jgi:hypothetical protein
MTRILYDGVNADTVPTGAWAVAGYVNGKWPSYFALLAKYPDLAHISISVNVSAIAKVLDVESGDATPAQAPQWVADQRATGNAFPVVYMSMAVWPAVKAAFVTRPDVAAPLYWVADYVTEPATPPAVPAGAVAIQYYDFGGYDASVALDYWPGMDPPQPTAAPAATEETDVAYYPIEVLPDEDGNVNATGEATWPLGGAHALQILADPGMYGAESGAFRCAFSLTTGPDVEVVHTATPGQKISFELAAVPGLNPAECSGVTITRPDNAKWPWGGGAV